MGEYDRSKAPKDGRRMVPATYLIFERDGKVALLRRTGTGYMDGMWMLPAGHVELGEAPTSAGSAEGNEEMGVAIGSLQCVHVMTRGAHDATGARVDFFFRVLSYVGEPYNRETDKSSALEWFSYDSLPEDLAEFNRIALSNYREGAFYSELDWE